MPQAPDPSKSSINEQNAGEDVGGMLGSLEKADGVGRQVGFEGSIMSLVVGMCAIECV